MPQNFYQDIHDVAHTEGTQTKVVHDRAEVFDIKAEALFRYLQVRTPSCRLALHVQDACMLHTALSCLLSLILSCQPVAVNHTTAILHALQVFSACVMSFTHGANDVSNAMGPFSAVYQIWSTGEVSSNVSAAR